NIKTNKLEPFEKEVLSTSGSVYGFEHDSEGNLYIATMEGLYVKNVTTGDIIQYTSSNSELKDSRLISILCDSNNRLWLGSISSGTTIFTWEDSQLKQVDHNLDLSTYKAVSFFEDSKNNVWISSEHEGLIKISYDLNAKSIFTKNQGIPNNSVSAITEAPEDIFWITTLKGFTRYDQKTDSFKNYTLSHGLPGLVFNRGAIINNYSTDGKVWLGTENGLVSFDPDIIEENKPVEKVTITDFYVDGERFLPSDLKQPVEQVNQIILKGTQAGIGFRYIAMNYFNPTDNNYIYRLTGRDTEWQKSTSNFVYYSNLKPGKYTFQVSLSGEPATITEIDLQIKPRWYQHAFFKLITAILILFIIVVTVKVIFNLKRSVDQVREEKDAAKEDQKKYETSHLTAKRSKEIEKLLKDHVESSKIYLNPDLKLQGLAAAINCAPHDVSQVINQNLNQSYYEFINRYRIEAVKKLMADQSYKKYTLLAIAQECGFNSKTSFYRAFKKLTGLTPVQYQNQLSKTHT
ncbi:MAG TPA: helix-turn-helix domain-containing protein, partial [Chitinispirillaceae bacterium]|nr:helix-turn-helix domain-containing protein [Chitinispirillaceae bacterium]